MVDEVIPGGVGASRKLLCRLEAAEAGLLVDMQHLASDWKTSFLKVRFVDLVLQRQGFSKLLWRSRMKVSGSQGFVDLFASDLLSSLPEHVVVAATRFEQPRLLLNARMKSVSSSRQAVEAYLESMRKMRRVELPATDAGSVRINPMQES
ncbi:MAG TPA: hypothetical protein EYP51_03310 [Thiotrichales bacterium]|nr:hypothetical protein [Thiotrichales bacterium]